MVIKKITFEQVLPQMINQLLTKKNTLVILSVNYEERTLGWLNSLPNNGDFRANFKIFVLRGSERVGLLENIKDKNIEKAKKRLEDLRVHYELETCNYPSGDGVESVKHNTRLFCLEVCRNTETDTEPNIIFDISGLPRRMIFSILDAIYELQKDKRLPPHLYIIYTTPSSYSQPHETGTLRTYFTNKNLNELLRRSKYLNLLLVPSSHGHETVLILEELKKIDVHIKNLHFIAPYYDVDPLINFMALLNNAEIMHNIRSYYNTQIHFPFSIVNAMEMIFELSADWEGENTTSLMALFNIKPLAVSVYYSIKSLLEKGISNVDALGLSTERYSSLYSIGVKDKLFFKVNIQWE
jgi:hypothetical protein